MKTRDVSGQYLDYLVGRAEELDELRLERHGATFVAEVVSGVRQRFAFRPSLDWIHGGPIIEREGISVVKFEECWGAEVGFENWIDTNDVDIDYTGPTPLIAAMRAYVGKKFGDTVDDAPKITG